MIKITFFIPRAKIDEILFPNPDHKTDWDIKKAKPKKKTKKKKKS